MVDAPNPNVPPKIPRTPRRARKKKVAFEARRGKEFTYRGHTLGELAALSNDDLIAAMPARARRFMTRMHQDPASVTLLAIAKETPEGGEMRTHLRDFPILPTFVGKTVHVHNGKEFTKVVVTAEMIGHKLGEFSPTRKSVKHTGPGVGATRSSKFMPLK
ncbi:MAG: 30S ribosomal protein S19 [Thermoplasmatota archaeon]